MFINSSTDSSSGYMANHRFYVNVLVLVCYSFSSNYYYYIMIFILLYNYYKGACMADAPYTWVLH